MSEKNEPKWLKPVTEYIPLAIFFGVYWMDKDLILATKAILIATGISLVVTYTLVRRIPMIPLVTSAILAVFGGLSIWFDDDLFIKIKPTIVQIFFALALGVGLYIRKIWLKMLLGSSMDIPDEAWITLTKRFMIFFLIMAALNEVVWRTMSEEFWVSFDVFGQMGITLVFVFSQIPFIMKNMPPDPEDEAEK